MEQSNSSIKALTTISSIASQLPASYDEFIKQFADGINERLGRINQNLFDLGDYLLKQCHWGKTCFNKPKEQVFNDVKSYITKYTPETLRVYEITARFIAEIKKEILPIRIGKIYELPFGAYQIIANAKLPQETKLELTNKFLDELPPVNLVRQHIKAKHLEIYPPSEDKNWLIPFDCWKFPTCDPRFGEDNFPGRIPGQIVQNLIHYYMKGDTFVSVYPGSHTDKDVCEFMGKKCIELNQDITQTWQVPDKSADFIFHDPPYWHAKVGEYEHESDLAKMPLKEFYDALDATAQESHRVLRTKGRTAIIIGNERNPYEDLAFKIYAIFQRYFYPLDRIIIPYAGTSTMHTAWAIAKAKKKGYMLNGYRDLMVFQKEA